MNNLPKNSDLRYIDPNINLEFDLFKPYKESYYIKFKKGWSFEIDLLSRMSKKGHKNLKYDIEAIKKLSPSVKINDFEDLDILIKLNKKRF